MEFDKEEDIVELKEFPHKKSSLPFINKKKNSKDRLHDGEVASDRVSLVTRNFTDRQIESQLAKTRTEMKLNPEGSTLLVKNLTVFVNSVNPMTKVKTVKDMFSFKAPPKENFTILDDISFYLKPGMMTLMLGGPGSGKTTVFKALAHRLKGAKMTGEVLLNGHKPSKKTHHRDVAYITQEDVHMPLLTVKETLRFSADCQMPETVDYKTKEEAVNQVMQVLGLSHRADTLVGNNLLRGVSGGEKRRISIGIEMVKGPNVMILDEPTTGLDASAALDVIKHLRKVANIGLPVMCSLLQPSQEILEMFTHVTIIAQGRIVYFGTLENVLPYFEERGFFCPPASNPADFLAEVVLDPFKYATSPSLLSVKDFLESYKNSSFFKNVEEEVKNAGEGRFKETNSESEILEDWSGQGKYPVSYSSQLKLNMKRAALMTIRDVETVKTRVMNAFVMALALGTLFLRQDNNQKGSNNIFGLIFFAVASRGFVALGQLPFFIEERRVFYEQRAGGYYSTITYYFSSVLSDIPLSTVEVFIFGTILYWLTGMNSSADRFFFFILILFSITQIAVWFIRICSILSPDFQVANSTGPAFLSTMLLFSGFIIAHEDMPDPWAWVYYVSIFHYPFEALAINQFSGTSLYCEANELLPPTTLPNFALPYPEGYNSSQLCRFLTGEDILKSMNLSTKSDDKWWLFFELMGYAALYLLIGFLGLYLVEFRPKKTPPLDESSTNAFQNEENSDLSLNNEKVAGTVTGTYVTVKNLCYYVGTKDKEIQLLRDVNGYFKPGMLVALMGASGAGKSTLLDVLADRKTGGRITGEMLFNGKPRDQFFKRMAAYVEQQDLHQPTQTVREAIEFSAKTRLDESIPLEEKLRFAQQVLKVLDLLPIAHRIIGEGNSGLSLEQRKRVTIGVELAANPSLLFLDEPTSGLDSGAADRVMATVKKISDQGRTVVCTIHQPSAKIFGLFTDLLLLKKGGYMVYYGPIGEKGQTLFSYFRQFGLECPAKKNPADWILEVTGAGIDHAEDNNVIQDPVETYNSSETFAEVKKHLDEGIIPQGSKFMEFKSIYATGIKMQLYLNLLRGIRTYWRRPDIVRLRMLSHILTGLLVGTLFFQLDNDQSGGRNRVAFLLFVVIYANMTALGCIPIIFEERPSYYRERSTASFRSYTYLFALIVREIPFAVLTTLLFSIPAYWIAGMNSDSGRFGYFVGLFFLICNSFTVFNQALAVSVPNMMIANILSGASNAIFILFAGFMIARPSIPNYWIWFYWVDPLKYPLEGFSLNELIGLTFYCKEHQYLQIPIYSNGTELFKEYCVTTTGENVLDNFGMFQSLKFVDLGVMAFIFAAFVIVMQLSLRFIVNIKR